jgi:hypothetical protein
MILRTSAIWAVLLAAGACTPFSANEATGQPSIAGQYGLATVNGHTLPCCALTDSTGTRITFVGGSLTLGEGAPEAFSATPAGYRPKSCVHALPDSAHVDTAGVVTLPDSSTYQLPKCTDANRGTYTLVITRRYDHADGTTSTMSDTSSGTYAWSNGEGGAPMLVSLLNSGMIGPITISERDIIVKVHGQHAGQGAALTPSDPEYEFSRITP